MYSWIHKIPCGYVRLDDQGRILEANEYLIALLNYEEAEIKNQFMDHFLSSASKIIFHSLFLMQIFTDGQMEEIYLTLKSKNKDDVPIQLNGTLSVQDGVTCIECIFVQITKRNRYEQELQSVRDELEEAYVVKNKILSEENRLRKLFETTLLSIHEGIIVTDYLGRVTIMNKLAEKYTGWNDEDAQRKQLSKVFHIVDLQSGNDCLPIIENELMKSNGHYYIRDVILKSKDKRERYIEGTAANIEQNGQILGMVMSFRDITKEHFQESVIDSFLNMNMDILCVYDMDMKIHKMNRRFVEILGYDNEELLGREFTEFIHEEDIYLLKDALCKILNYNEVQEFTSRIYCKNGSIKYFELRIQQSMGEYIFASARDVTLKTKEKELLVNKAMKDQLTGLFNRHYLDRMIYDEMKESNELGRPLCMAIIDLDKFKLVNDTWGHPVGDDQLRTTAQIACQSLRTNDWLIRFGGEEFVVVLPNTNLEEAFKVLDKLRVAYEMNDHPVTGKQTLSIGVACLCENETFQNWYERVDEALYLAKTSGRNRVMKG